MWDYLVMLNLAVWLSVRRTLGICIGESMAWRTVQSSGCTEGIEKIQLMARMCVTKSLDYGCRTWNLTAANWEMGTALVRRPLLSIDMRSIAGCLLQSAFEPVGLVLLSSIDCHWCRLLAAITCSPQCANQQPFRHWGSADRVHRLTQKWLKTVKWLIQFSKPTCCSPSVHRIPVEWSELDFPNLLTASNWESPLWSELILTSQFDSVVWLFSWLRINLCDCSFEQLVLICPLCSAFARPMLECEADQTFEPNDQVSNVLKSFWNPAVGSCVFKRILKRTKKIFWSRLIIIITQPA